MKIVNYLKNNYRNILEFILAQIIAAVNFNLLLKPINLVVGGASGLSLVLSNIINISISNLITIIFFIMFLISLIFLEKKTIRSIVFASILYPFLVKITENITNILILKYQDLLLICIVSGILSGISNGIVYRNNYASGGISVLAPIINKYFKISISTVNFALNAIIVLFGGYFYGINMVLYAIILLFISSYVSNIIILGVSQNRIIYVESKLSDKLIMHLRNTYNVTATILENEKNDNSTFFAVISKKKYANITREMKLIDKDIFFVVSDCYEVG